MIEQSQRPLARANAGDLDALQQRVKSQLAKHKQARQTQTIGLRQVSSVFGTSYNAFRRLPSRFLLHAVVVLILPLAVLISQIPPGVFLPERELGQAASQGGNELAAPVIPLSLDQPQEIGDAPLIDDEIPVPLSLVSLNEALAPVVVPAMIAGDKIFLRNGPGTNYDAVGRMTGGTAVQVIGRYDDWFEIRESVDKPVYWVSGELLDMSEAASYTLFEVADSAIPAPPPPKIGIVKDDGVQLRDGPGTNYISMNSLIKGQIDLLERYQDWYHVSVVGQEGWVKAELIDVAPTVLDRLLVADTIPDANPALIATTIENQINLRKGPDSRHSRVGMVDAGMKLDLIGKFKDWFRVQTADGTKAWVFGDFLRVSPHVARRVPVSKDFPALPATASGSRGRMVASADLARIAASGDVAGYATQFVGFPYVWGGSSPRGFDCSGFTSYVYRQVAGVGLPRSAAAQWSGSGGASVGSMNNLAPGDLMFFVNTGGKRGISHVAMYIGGGRMVHAMTPRYGVQISGIWDSYWTSHYYGALRIRR